MASKTKFSTAWEYFVPLKPGQLCDQWICIPAKQNKGETHYSDVIMGAMGAQITSLTIVYSTVHSGVTSKLRVTGLCAGNSPMTGEFPAQMASYAESVSIW